MTRLTPLCTLLLLASAARAQQSADRPPTPAASPTADRAAIPERSTAATELLNHLAAQTADYRRTLPSFTCDEDVVSSVGVDGRIEKRVNFQATLRVVRQPDGELQEAFNVTRYKGKSVKPKSNVEIPIVVEGGLSKGLPGFFSAGTQACYRYTVTPESGTPSRVDFKATSRASECEIVHSAQGFALLDPAGNITHGETHQLPEYASRHELTTYGVIDYASIPLNGREYRLPTRLYAEMQDHDWLGTFDAHYSNCRLFHATITLGPATIQPAATPR